ncbi:hypothetical protein CASFOL_010104 [Castilleja foliolosa]|uniref:Uncharacterized protein n=1 Tax=Castilleja foliolosa TaxID=1961234 RepID=A0ABD3DSQ8_9LAMI
MDPVCITPGQAFPHARAPSPPPTELSQMCSLPKDRALEERMLRDSRRPQLVQQLAETPVSNQGTAHTAVGNTPAYEDRLTEVAPDFGFAAVGIRGSDGTRKAKSGGSSHGRGDGNPRNWYGCANEGTRSHEVNGAPNFMKSRRVELDLI